MSEEERRKNEPETPQEPESWDLEDAPKPAAADEELGERLTGTADSVTSELRDLQGELTPPLPDEEPVWAPTDAVIPGPAGEEPAAPGELHAPGEPTALPEEAQVPPPAEPALPLTPAPRMADTWTEETTRRTAPAGAGFAPEGTDDDRLMAALAWFTMVILQLPIVSVIQLLSTNTKDRPFQRHHAISSLLFYAGAFVYEVVAAIVYVILGTVTLGCGFACLWVIFFVPHVLGLYYAFQAYSGKRVKMPLLTDLGHGQGWL